MKKSITGDAVLDLFLVNSEDIREELVIGDNLESSHHKLIQFKLNGTIFKKEVGVKGARPPHTLPVPPAAVLWMCSAFMSPIGLSVSSPRLLCIH